MKKTSLTIILLLFFLGGSIFVYAQSSANYNASWYVVAGGGETSSSSHFKVSGTIGQLAVGQSNSGSYQAETGYWWVAHCPAPLVAVAHMAGNVVFSWSGSLFDVYRAVDDPYFVSGSQIGTGVSSGWAYTDPLLGNVGQNAYYAVGSSVGCGRRLGEFDFAIVAGN